MATRVHIPETGVADARDHWMPADRAAEALVASMRLNGIERLDGVPAVLDMWMPKLVTGEV